MTDITSLINDTHREIGERRIAGSEVRTVVLRRSYDAPIEDVWDACTDPDRLNRWFLPVTGELRVGGRYQLKGNAGGERYVAANRLTCLRSRGCMGNIQPAKWSCTCREAQPVTPSSSSNTVSPTTDT
jgi:Activator of Hsp90 ATPase homolog 1-like protein